MSDQTDIAKAQLDKYELLEKVGQGGMAIVYRGLDTALNREVAVKILHPHLANDEESRRRFHREAQAVAKLHHDNILEIYDYSGLDSPRSYIVTELIHGQTLKRFLARHPISHPEIAAMIAYEVCRALAHAHASSVIHRDIKPENIMIRRDGRIKLTDFGIAQTVDVTKLTATGQLLGSPAYMSPELVTGQPLDCRSDVFSTGTLLYQLASGELPFQGNNAHEMLKRIADADPTKPELVNPIVDSQLGSIIRKALQRDQEDRYPRITELQADLGDYLCTVGIEAPHTELSRYFADPPAYSRELQGRVVDSLLRLSKETLARSEQALALQQLDRLLCIDPQNGEALQRINGLSRRRRRLRTLQIGIVAALLTLTAYLIAAYLPKRGSAPSPPPAPSPQRFSSGTTRPASEGIADLGGVAAIRDAAAEDLDSPQRSAPPSPLQHARAERRTAARATDRNAARPEERRATPRSARKAPTLHRKRPSAADSPRRIEIVPTPKAVTIWMNGRELGVYGPDLRALTLPPGAVDLVFRNEACCFERRVIIGPGQRPERMLVKLAWKPARVVVNVQPQVPTDVLVGSIVARAGQAIEVPIPSYSSDGRVQMRVKVSADGYATAVRMLSLRANVTTAVPVALGRLP